jgi:hypothetical protein
MHRYQRVFGLGTQVNAWQVGSRPTSFTKDRNDKKNDLIHDITKASTINI